MVVHSVGFEIPDGKVQIKKEGLHPIYTPRIITKKVKYRSEEIACANKTYDLPSGGVKIEGWRNGQKVIEATDDLRRNFFRVNQALVETYKKVSDFY